MKKRFVKVLGMVLAMSISVTLLVSCGQSAESQTESTSAGTELVE